MGRIRTRHQAKRALAMKMLEYAPIVNPIIKVKAKVLRVSPPNRNRENKVSKVAKTVLIERDSDCVTESSTIYSIGKSG